ncbi:MAG: Vancomycin B-type resistance protein VanW, partial [uncultured Nocardioides sp.]
DHDRAGGARPAPATHGAAAADPAAPAAAAPRRARPPGASAYGVVARLADGCGAVGHRPAGRAASPPRQAARVAAAPRPRPRPHAPAAQQGHEPGAGGRTGGRPRRPAGRDVLLQPGRRQLHAPQGVRRGDAPRQRLRRARRRRRHLPARQPPALDGAPLTADRRGALGALLRPVPGQRARAPVGRGVLDRLQLRRPGRPERHGHHVPARGPPRRAVPARAAPLGPPPRALLPRRGAARGVRAVPGPDPAAQPDLATRDRPRDGRLPARRAGPSQLRPGGLRARARRHGGRDGDAGL